ncbi:flagellar FlbD family protein [Geomicrobium sp. JCM 19039]|uniref:flagellar FlbD family protein n=1 Tax=Geomicrobium sp. JCM 19039 TaxID=1460636 RepID=UPI00045F419B|nr:flagellar FlbD family protein [Geomicrobium sp. JCM 19039]GAK10929.1 hypothetical protein JCM19039_588 [Geomicrobium sp. JCM 19039]
MIRLLRLDETVFYLSFMQIETVESLPDTTLTLTNNRKLVVRNTLDDVIEQIETKYETFGIVVKSRPKEEAE